MRAYSRRMQCHLADHPLRNSIRLQLKSHPLLAGLDEAAHAELLEGLVIEEGQRGERLMEQGSCELRHYFILEGLLKRVVTSAEGREMTLNFASEGDMETCYEARHQQAGCGFAIVCARRALVASLSMDAWCGFIDRHPAAQQAFQERLLRLGAAIVDHAVALLLLDAPSRVNRFSFRHPELVERLPQKDVASHLNLSPETLCRLTRRHRPAVAS
jgi:CRP-like cAMP-binding protein